MTINKRVAISFLTIVGVMSLVVALTVAVFSGNATLSNNSLDTGSADLQIAEVTTSCGTFSGSITPGIQAINLAPGQSDTKDFCLKNNSDSNISLDVTVGSVTVNSNTLTPSLVNLSVECAGEGLKDVGTVAAPNMSVVITTLTHLQEKECVITAQLDSSATNADANKILNFDVEFTGTQTP